MLASAFGNLRHHRSFAFVAITSTTNDGDQFGILSFDFSNGLYDIINGIGRVGVINDSSPSFWAVNGFEAAVHRLQRREYPKHVEFVKSKAQGGAVDTEEIGYIKTSDKRHKHFLAIDIQQHAVEAFFQNLRFVIRQRAGRIGMYSCFAVLRHDQTVLVIFIGDSEGAFFECVKEAFLCVAVVIEGLVIINMIACKVGEQRSVEVESGNAFLCDGMAADFHESVSATGIYHATQQTVQLQCIRSGVGGWNGFVFNIIDNCRKQTCFVSHRAHEFI